MKNKEGKPLFLPNHGSHEYYIPIEYIVAVPPKRPFYRRYIWFIVSVINDLPDHYD